MTNGRLYKNVQCFAINDFALCDTTRIRKSDPNESTACGPVPPLTVVRMKPGESMSLHDSNVMPAERICTHIHTSSSFQYSVWAPRIETHPDVQSDRSFPSSSNINASSFVMQLHDATTASTRGNDRFRQCTIAVHPVFPFLPVVLFFYYAQNNRDLSLATSVYEKNF